MLNNKEYRKIHKECFNLSRKKNKDYGTSNLEEFGQTGILIRMWDKYCRLKNLLINNKTPVIKDEKIEDTLKDIINYSTYLIMMRRGKLK